MKLDYDFKYYNFLLLILVICLNICGVFVVNSASNMDQGIVSRQIMGTMASICACLVVSFIDYRRLIKYARLLYVISIVLLLAVLAWGAAHGGASRWIVFPVLGQVQPTEFIKVTLIIFYAWYFEKHEEDLSSPRTVLRAAALFALPAALILLEPNLSTTIIFSVIFAGIYFAAGLNYKWILGILGSCAALIGLLFYSFGTGLYEKIPLLTDYQKLRILGFLYPEQYSDTYAQQASSITAIASGGFAGKGLYNTDISSVKAGNFLIEEDTDFIFAIIGEELGFRGCLMIFITYLIILMIILYIAGRARDEGGRLICVGVAVWIGFQTFTNVAVATGLFPNTGVTLPFFSRGISSLLALYIGLGLVLNVGLQRKSK